MRIIEIQALENGAHRNQIIDHGDVQIPDLWAIIPDDMECPNFPFGGVEVEEVVCTRYVESLQEVTKTREVVSYDEEGNEVITIEEYTQEEIVSEPEEYTVLVVSKWIPGEMPEVEVIVEPTTAERVEALEQENKLLKTQISAQSDQMAFYEACIVEMAEIVYA